MRKRDEKKYRDRNDIIDYCDRFTNLSVNSSRKKGGNAPHKPILLLAVLDSIAQGEIRENKIKISTSLVQKYYQYWDLLNTTQFNKNFALPFFHLKNEKNKFWHLKYTSTYDGGRPQTLNRLQDDVEYAYLDPELFDLLQNLDSCQALLDALVIKWFSCQNNIYHAIESIQGKLFLDFRQNENVKQQIKHRKYFVRSSLFRKAVLHLYDGQCAICGLKVNFLSQSIVEGAHIKPFSRFFDNRLNNGIALCRNHHWAFDKGIFTIATNYTVLASRLFEEQSPNNKSIQEFSGKQIILPKDSIYYPHESSLIWHKDNIFCG